MHRTPVLSNASYIAGAGGERTRVIPGFEARTGAVTEPKQPAHTNGPYPKTSGARLAVSRVAVVSSLVTVLIAATSSPSEN